MIRLLFIPFLTLLCFSCEHVLDKDDSLFHQISSADSVRCTNEILDELRQESKSYEKLLDEYMWETCVDWDRLSLEVLDIKIDSVNQMSSSLPKEESGIQETVLEFFYHFRNQPVEISKSYRYSSDLKNYLAYRFFNQKSLKALKSKREETYQSDRSYENADPLLIEYYKSQVAEVESYLDLSNVLRADSIALFSEHARVQIDADGSPEKYQEIFEQVLLGYYQVRNYECLRYFGESYLSLYERSKRSKRKVDVEKLEALKIYRPVRICNINNNGAIRVFAPVIQVD